MKGSEVLYVWAEARGERRADRARRVGIVSFAMMLNRGWLGGWMGGWVNRWLFGEGGGGGDDENI